MVTNVEDAREERDMPPPGFLEIRKGNVVVWVKEAFSFLFDEANSWRMELSSLPVESTGAKRGRGKMTRMALDPEGKAYGLVRHYQRGGAVRHLLGDRYLGCKRFFDEVRTAEKARGKGIHTSEVLALRTENKGWGFHTADLMTLEIQGAQDLDSYLGSLRHERANKDVMKKREVLICVASMLAHMHSAGLFHADLNLKNILVGFGPLGVRSYVIDLDRARFMMPLSRKGRFNNLIRLYRSLEKLGHMGDGVTSADLVRFVKVYCGDDLEMKEMLKERLRRPPFSLKAHRFFWRLDRSG